jgi:NDP-sugar pyrophosphorylase family protein
MNAILLCAGYGTRLYPMTKNTPKGLLEVGGKPILDYQMPQLLSFPELEAIHLVSNARFVSQFYVWMEKWRVELESRKVKFHLHNNGSLSEDDRLGSVGDLAFVLRYVDRKQPVVITVGDNIFRFPLRPIAESFLESDHNIVLALYEQSYQVRQRYAVVEFGQDDVVTRLHDQPENPPTEWVCPSLYFLKPEALSLVEPYLAGGGHYDSIAGFIDHVAQNESVRAVRKSDSRMWLDVETRYKFKKANEVLETEPLLVEE